jgi:tryptophan-rich sensory protein
MPVPSLLQGSSAVRLRLALFITAILLAGFLIGYTSNPQASYAGFAKPSFAPPAWVFGPVWTLLYVMIGIAGWRLYETDPRSTEMRLWWAQMALNFAWTPVFFTAGARALALAIILTLLALIVALVLRLWPRDRTAALLLVPYAGWVGFATALNAAIVALN